MALLINTIVSVAILAVICSAREYNCIMDKALCAGSQMQTVEVSGMPVCCPKTATLKSSSSQCLCSEPNAALGEECLRGASDCKEAESFTRDSSQAVRCCMPGFTMTFVQPASMSKEVCACTPIMLTPDSVMSSINSVMNPAGGSVNRAQLLQMAQVWGFGSPGFMQRMQQLGATVGGGGNMGNLSSILSMGQPAGTNAAAYSNMIGNPSMG